MKRADRMRLRREGQVTLPTDREVLLRSIADKAVATDPGSEVAIGTRAGGPQALATALGRDVHSLATRLTPVSADMNALREQLAEAVRKLDLERQTAESLRYEVFKLLKRQQRAPWRKLWDFLRGA